MGLVQYTIDSLHFVRWYCYDVIYFSNILDDLFVQGRQLCWIQVRSLQYENVHEVHIFKPEK